MPILRSATALGRHGPLGPCQQRHLPRRGPGAPVQGDTGLPGPRCRCTRSSSSRRWCSAAARCRLTRGLSPAANDGLTLAHEIYDSPQARAETRTVYLRAEDHVDHRLTHAERSVVDEHRGRPTSGDRSSWSPVLTGTPTRRPCVAPTSARRRRSHVTDFEYVQEARIQYRSACTRAARVLHYREPIPTPPADVRRALVDRPPREPGRSRSGRRRPGVGRCLGGPGPASTSRHSARPRWRPRSAPASNRSRASARSRLFSALLGPPWC